MKISDKGIKLIKYYEGFKQVSYFDKAGSVWTIGYGSTKGVKRGMGISEAFATEWLIRDANEAAEQIEKVVTVKLNQDQMDALISFVYNLGIGRLKESTLLKRINENRFSEVPEEFDKWVYGGGQVLPGLVKRRKSEATLWTTGVLDIAR